MFLMWFHFNLWASIFVELLVVEILTFVRFSVLLTSRVINIVDQTQRNPKQLQNDNKDVIILKHCYDVTL